MRAQFLLPVVCVCVCVRWRARCSPLWPLSVRTAAAETPPLHTSSAAPPGAETHSYTRLELSSKHWITSSMMINVAWELMWIKQWFVLAVNAVLWHSFVPGVRNALCLFKPWWLSAYACERTCLLLAGVRCQTVSVLIITMLTITLRGEASHSSHILYIKNIYQFNMSVSITFR